MGCKVGKGREGDQMVWEGRCYRKGREGMVEWGVAPVSNNYNFQKFIS